MEGKRVGAFAIEAAVGSGGMGTVYRARVVEATDDLEPGSLVALKVIHPHLLARDGFLARFRREARLGRLVRHRGVVATAGLGSATVDGRDEHFLVMEYVEGRTLRVLLEAMGRVPEALLREIARQIADGLAAIHAAGIVHRDLKPANVLITDDHQIRIMDLGVARLVEESLALTQQGAFVGSLPYAAPEQFEGGTAEPASDLYSVGVLLRELATGRNVFALGDAPRVIAAHMDLVPPLANEDDAAISPFLAELIACLLAKRESERPASATELVQILDEGEASDWWARRQAHLRATTVERQTIRVRRDADFVGREDVLAQLRDAWRAARGADGSVAWIEGEPGIGKTRLFDAFVREVDPATARVLYGSYAPSGGAGGLSDAVAQAFGAARLEAALRPYLRATPRLVEPFARLVRHEVPSAGHEALPPAAVHTVMCHLMRGLAAERPLLWIVDDLHFAEPASRAMVLSLARALHGHRVVLLIGTRPGLPEDEVAQFSLLRRFRRTTIERLSPRDVMLLVRAAVGTETLADRIGGQIAYKSDGVPLFALEMIREMVDSGLIRRGEDGSFESTGDLSRIDVPSAVRDLIRGRLRDLSDEERAILNVAAVQGFEFDADLIARVREVKRVVVLERLASLERRSGLICSEGRRCRFDHHQIPDVLYRDLMPELREEYHTLLAEAFSDRESIEPDDAVEGQTAQFLASHHLRGAEPRRGLPALGRALDHLTGGHRYVASCELADLALGRAGLLRGLSRERVLLRKAQNLEYLGRPGEQGMALDEARAIADESGDPRRRSLVRTQMAWRFLTVSSPVEARTLLEAAVELACAAGDVVGEAAATGHLGTACLDLGRLRQAEEHYLRQLELAGRVGATREAANALGNLGIVLRRAGRPAEARQRFEEALALVPESRYGRDEGRTLHNLAVLANTQGLYHEAGKRNAQALEVLRQVGDRAGEAAAVGSLAGVSRTVGDLARTLELRRSQLQLSREIGSRHGELVAVANQGCIHTVLGAFETAGDALTEALDGMREIKSRHGEGYVLHWLGELRAAEGLRDEGAALLADALALRRELAYPSGIAATLLSLGRVYQERGEQAAAVRALDEAIATSERNDAAETHALAAAYRSLLPGGSFERAVELAQQYYDRMRHEARMESAYVLWQASGDARHLDLARELLEDLVARAPEEYRETMRQRVPLHRHIAEATE